MATIWANRRHLSEIEIELDALFVSEFAKPGNSKAILRLNTNTHTHLEETSREKKSSIVFLMLIGIDSQRF